MIFPGFPGVPSFFQVFQVEWEPWPLSKLQSNCVICAKLYNKAASVGNLYLEWKVDLDQST